MSYHAAARVTEAGIAGSGTVDGASVDHNCQSPHLGDGPWLDKRS